MHEQHSTESEKSYVQIDRVYSQWQQTSPDGPINTPIYHFFPETLFVFL
uniref:Uncharacterized protein n=1 Tax=Moniliophthora roreri TaxID=221103 RepID=A0A0W0FK57_MONRR